MVRLWLSLIAYNLGNLWRRLALPKGIGNWSLTSLQQRLVKTGGRLIKHARYYWILLAESHLTRRLFAGHSMPRSSSRPRRKPLTKRESSTISARIVAYPPTRHAPSPAAWGPAAPDPASPQGPP